MFIKISHHRLKNSLNVAKLLCGTPKTRRLLAFLSHFSKIIFEERLFRQFQRLAFAERNGAHCKGTGAGAGVDSACLHLPFAARRRSGAAQVGAGKTRSQPVLPSRTREAPCKGDVLAARTVADRPGKNACRRCRRIPSVRCTLCSVAILVQSIQSLLATILHSCCHCICQRRVGERR
jgi:hypothetical protein